MQKNRRARAAAPNESHLGSMRPELISPDYVGEDRFRLQLATPVPLALNPVQIDADYSDADPEKASLPLELIVQGPSGASFESRIFRSTKPSSFVFVPQEAGEYLIVLREVHHNRWQGRLLIDVKGDRFSR